MIIFQALEQNPEATRREWYIKQVKINRGKEKDTGPRKLEQLTSLNNAYNFFLPCLTVFIEINSKMSSWCSR